MDAVILYVNSSDKEWLEDYKSQHLPPIDPVRYRDWGTLPFLFRGIAKYMPFIENVFLVVSRESQVPVWIDRDKVKIVLHKDIIPQIYLPTFNSCVIETHIPYIKGLAEEFIYFNDDMFPVGEMTADVFFKDGRPQDLLRERHISNPPVNVYRYQCLNSTNFAKRCLGLEETGKYNFPLHWTHPMLKSCCLEVLRKMGGAYTAQISKLRTIANVNQYLFLNYMYYSGVLDNVELPFQYVSPNTNTPEGVAEQIEKGTSKILCLNDADNSKDFARYVECAREAFKKKFPEKCKYERGFVGAWNEDIVVSMASYPARINGVAGVWKSVLNQKTQEPFRCVLVLFDGDFPDKKLPYDLQELIDCGLVELMWYPRNIRSHLKLLPVIKRYPEANIITIDDDMYKPQGWLQGIIDDHKKHPEDVISTSFTFFLDSEMKWGRMLDLNQKVSRGKNDVPSLVFNFARICSGHGTLFPAHTFTDKRFFDEDAMMQIAPTCDETWMWCFAMISGKYFRQTSWVYDESAYTLAGTQQMPTALYKANRKIYDTMYAELFRVYPEFKAQILERRSMYLVALEDVDDARKANPYHAIVTTADKRKIDTLLKMYWDRPNRIAEFEGSKLYPPSIGT